MLDWREILIELHSCGLQYKEIATDAKVRYPLVLRLAKENGQYEPKYSDGRRIEAVAKKEMAPQDYQRLFKRGQLDDTS